jgi:hypothetical protein
LLFPFSRERRLCKDIVIITVPASVEGIMSYKHCY